MVFTHFDAFGDSITFGSVATSIGTNDWVSLLATELGYSYTNHGVGGNFAMDQADLIASMIIESDSFCTYMIGANECFNGWPGDVSKINEWSEILRAQLVWMSLLDSTKIQGQGEGAGAPDITGSWTNSFLGSVKTVSSGTAAFETEGSVAYLCTLYDADASGSFTLTTDGVNQGTFNTVPVTTMQTNLGRRYGPRLIRVSGLSDDIHSHVMTWVNGTVYFCWSGGNAGISQNPGPVVYCGNVTPQKEPIETPLSHITTINGVIESSITLLRSDGLSVHSVDDFSFVDLSDISGDGIHPDNMGHQHIFEAFFEVITSVPPDTPTFTETPSNPSGSDVTFSFISSGALTYESSLDGGPFIMCSNPQIISGVSLGVHTYSVRAVNIGGESMPVTFEWVVEGEAIPDFTIGFGVGTRRGARP